jgi:hypothetical protein
MGDRLASIKAKRTHNGVHPWYEIDYTDVDWLIAEVERLRERMNTFCQRCGCTSNICALKQCALWEVSDG